MNNSNFVKKLVQIFASALIAGTTIVASAAPSFTFSGSGAISLVAVDPAGDVSISIPSTSGNAPVRSIAADAFAGCGDVTDIRVPSSIETIDAGAFDDCASLTGIWVEEGNPAFSGNDGALYDFSGEVLITCPPGRSGTFTIPEGVKSVADGAFANCQFLTKIVIPASVTDIGAGAFSDCISLESVIVPSTRQYDLAKLSIPNSCAVSSLQELGRSSPPRWTAVFNSNGGTGTMAEQVFSVGVTAKLNANAFMRTGYTFAGWALSASGSVVFSNGQSVRDLASAGNSVTLFAKWTPIRYTVRFNGNCGFGSMADITCTWDTTRALPAMAFSRKGFKFAGWGRSTGGGGPIEFTDRQSVKNLCATPNGTVVLYAKWTGIPYTAIFHEEPTGGRTASQALRYGTRTTLRKNTFTKSGYVFMGWSLTPNGNVTHKDEQAVEGVTANGGTVHFYARWAVRNYSVHFSANGGTGSMADQSFVFGTPSKLRAIAFTLAHNVFVGWSLTPDGPIQFANKATISTLTSKGHKVTLYARWRRIRYTVVFDPNGGSGSMANQTFIYGVSDKLRAMTFNYPPGPTRVFAGWSKVQTGKIDYGNCATVCNLSLTDGAIVRLYARWAIRDYKVRFNANGGTGSMADEAFVYGAAKALNANAFSRQNHLFLGWARSASATKPEYTNRQSVRNLTGAGGVVTLYAIWKKMGDPNIVLCLGDSITEGYRCVGLPYPSRLASLSGKTVRNYGRGGECSDYGADIAEEALKKENPGYVCILFGANDAIHHRDPSWTKENLRQVIRLCKKYNAKPIIASPPPQIGDHARFDPEVKNIARQIRYLAQEEGVTFVDFYTIFDNPKKYLNPADGLHLSDAGGSLMARSFYAAF